MAETHGPEKLSVRPGMHHWVQLSDVPGDAPVFDGTDVPVQRLVDYPTAERDQAVRAIELAGLLLEAMAYESALTEAEGSPRPQGYRHTGPVCPSDGESVTTQLHEAAWKGHTETVHALIAAAGADPDSYSIRRYGGTTLHKAASQGHAATVRALLSAGADPNLHSTHRYGGTPLRSAAWSGDPETTRVLIAGGADTEARDEYGGTPIHWATQHRKVEVAMLEGGADPNSRDNFGNTPLHTAASLGQHEIARALIAADAVPNSRDDEGRTPCTGRHGTANQERCGY